MRPPPELRAAFLGSSYGTAERGMLRPGPGPAPSWARGIWGIVTAWNPRGQQASPEANAQQQRDLAGILRGRPYRSGWNGEGEWCEPTFIVSGLSLGTLACLGGTFCQAAVLYGSGRRAALVWLEDAKVYALERYFIVAEC